MITYFLISHKLYALIIRTLINLQFFSLLVVVEAKHPDNPIRQIEFVKSISQQTTGIYISNLYK